MASLFLFGIFLAVFILISFKYIFKPLLILLFLIAAISAYTMDHYGYVISAATFRNILETDTHEVLDLLNWQLCKYMVIFFILPVIGLLLTCIKYPSFKSRLFYILLCVIVCIANVLLFSKYYASTVRNNRKMLHYINPVRPMYAITKYVVQSITQVTNHNFIELDPNPTRIIRAGKPKLIVLVVGESDRAANQQLNGYAQQTNPRLAARGDVYSFGKFYSCGTETTVSVPCMFSVFTRQEYTHQKAMYTENVLDLLRKSDIDILWRDNDSGCKNVCDRVHTDDLNAADIKPYCVGGECHDEVLLYGLQNYISANKRDKLIVLHKKGNHGPAYYKRYPAEFAHFVPTCDTNELQDCTDQQIVNTYNNIILYTDYFLDSVIQTLNKNSDQYQTALLYVSDHGESLGEHGIYLHAMPYRLAPKEQTHIPFMFWASEDFDINRKHLAAILQREFSHDYLFHSLLGLFDVQSTAYIKDLDMFVADGLGN